MDLSALIDAVATLNADDAFGARLSREAWEALAPLLTRHEIRAGDLLLKQDDRDGTMYFLERGSLQVFVTRSAPGTHRVAILRAGSVVGEAGLFGNTPRMAVIVRRTPSLSAAWRACSIGSDGVHARLMVCTNGDGAHHEGSRRGKAARPATA